MTGIDYAFILLMLAHGSDVAFSKLPEKVAHVMDSAGALAFLGLVTFGLTWLLIPILYPAVALLYNGLTISGWRRATPGMRLMDLEMRLMDGSRTPFINAAAHAVLFYLSWTILTPLVLVVALASRNKRCLHDMLSSVIVTRRSS